MTNGVPPPRGGVLRQVPCPHCRLVIHAVPGTVSDCPGCQTAVRVPPAAKLDGVVFSESADFPPPALGSTGSPSAVFDAPVPSGSASSPPDCAVGDRRFWTPLGRRRDGYDGGYELGQLPSGRARWYYVMPGVIFLLFSLFVILLVLGRMILPFLLLVRTEVPFRPAANVEKLLWAGVQSGLGTLVGMAVGVVYFLGGVAMIRRRGLTMARVAAIAACIPCLNALVLTPIGIWACMLAFGRNAREDFDA